MAWGGDNNLYIADEGIGPNYKGQVVRFDANGKYLGVFVANSATLTDPLGLAFIVTPLGAPAPQNYNTQVAFRETGASMWGATVPGLIQKTFPATFGWDTHGDVGGSGVYDIATPAINLGLFTIPRIDYGSFGGSFIANTHGTAGLNFIGTLNAGSVNVNYPVNYTLNFPDRNYLFAGDWFPLTTTGTADAAANFGTVSPRVKAEADLILNGYLKVRASAVAFSKSIFDTTIMPPRGYPQTIQRDINGNPISQSFQTSATDGTFIYDRKLFDTDSLLGTLTTFNYSFLSGAVTGYVKLPFITTTGMPDSSGNIATTGSDTFFNIRGSLSDFARNTIQDETGIYVPIGSDGVGKHFAGSGFDAGYSFLDIYANLNLNVAQDFSFKPKPHIKLQMLTGQTVNWRDKNNTQYNNVNAFEFDAGDPVQVQMPSSANLQFTATYTLPHTFAQTLSLVIDPSLNLNVLELTASGSVGGYTLANFDFQPIPTQTINLQTFGVNAKFPLWSTGNFTLPGFQSTTQQGITVSGRLHPAPGLSSINASQPGLAANQIGLIIVPYIFNSTTLPSNVSGQTTPIMIKGYNFPASGSQAWFTIHGSAPVALATTTQDNCNLTAQLPNKYLLIAGTGQIYVTAPNTTGASNSLGLAVVNPAPSIRNVGPNVFAADPTFTVGSPLLMTVTDNSTTFLWSPKYYNTIKSQWFATYNSNMDAFFPGYDFSTAVSLPAIHFKGSDNVDRTLALYEEAQPSGLLWAVLPYSYYSRPDKVSVTIISPGPGGGVSNPIPLTFGFVPPVINSTGGLNPATILPGNGNFRLTVLGPTSLVPAGYTDAHGNFNIASTIQWDGTPLTTTFINSGELRADIPASYVATAGAHTIKVVTAVANGAGGGATNYTSNSVTFAVKNPLPVLKIVDANTTALDAKGVSNILNPPSAISADPGFLGQPTAPQYNLAVQGTGFVSTSTVLWNGATLPTQYVTDTLVKAAVPYANVAAPTTATIKVSNPTDGGGGGVSNGVTFAVTNATPTLTVLGASALQPGISGYDLPLQGTGFYSGSVANFNGSPRVTTFSAQNALSVHLTAADLAAAGTAQITVTNTPGGTSNALALVIGATVSGTLNFEGINPTAPTQNVTFTFRPTDNSAVFSRTLQVPASGVFSVSGLPQKNYTVHIKGNKYLAVNVAANATAGNVTGLTAFQPAADGNNDNSVDSSDFTLLIGAYNSDKTIPGSGYDPTADFNSDGSVDSSDFTLLIGEFNNVGAN